MRCAKRTGKQAHLGGVKRQQRARDELECIPIRQVAGADRSGDGAEQRGDRCLFLKRDVRSSHGDWNTRDRQGAPQALEMLRRPGDHRHVIPCHRRRQVQASQVVRDPRGEVRPRVVRQHSQGARGDAVRSLGMAVGAQVAGSEARQCRLAPYGGIGRADLAAARVVAIEDDDMCTRLLDQTKGAEPIASPETERGDIRVGEDDRGCRRTGQRHEQVALEGAGLLEVINPDALQLPCPPRSCADRELQQTRVVDDPLEGHHVVIDLGEVPEDFPCRDASVAAHLGQALRVNAQLASTSEDRAQVVGEAEG